VEHAASVVISILVICDVRVDAGSAGHNDSNSAGHSFGKFVYGSGFANVKPEK